MKPFLAFLLTLAMAAPLAAGANAREDFVARARALFGKAASPGHRHQAEASRFGMIQRGELPLPGLERQVDLLRQQLNDPEVNRLADVMLAEAREELNRRAEAIAREIEAEIASILPKVIRAERATELDPVLASLAGAEPRFPDDAARAEELRRKWSRREDVRRLVTYWQDLLWASEHGNAGRARNGFHEAERLCTQHADLFPRTQMLDRLAVLRRHSEERMRELAETAGPQARALAIVAGIRSMEELRRALPRVQELARSQTAGEFDWQQGQDFVGRLAHFLQTYDNVRGGTHGSYEVFRHLEHATMRSHEQKPELEPIRRIFYSETLPRLLDPLATEHPKIEDGIAWLREAWRAAISREDWERAENVAGVLYQPTRFNVIPPNDVKALRFLRAARNFDAAGEYTLATSNYHWALGTGASFLANASIRARVEALQREHPKEYERGLQISATQPPDPWPGR